MTEPTPENALSRADRRYVEKQDLPCKVCGIRWSQRLNQWSICTINVPPTLIAEGHRFV